MNVKVYLSQKPGVMTDVVIMGAEAVVYEKANENTGKPDVIVVQKEVKKGDWSEYQVLAEFHACDVVGWANVDHLPTKDQ